jgi:type II secretory pathway pseudopilin PulG
MAVLVVVLVIAALFVAYATERLLKIRARARRLREMEQRLSAAAARAESLDDRRQAVAEASGALTALVPAINHPVTTSDETPS